MRNISDDFETFSYTILMRHLLLAILKAFIRVCDMRF